MPNTQLSIKCEEVIAPLAPELKAIPELWEYCQRCTEFYFKETVADLEKRFPAPRSYDEAKATITEARIMIAVHQQTIMAIGAYLPYMLTGKKPMILEGEMKLIGME